MPIKLTWKSLSGLASVIVGFLHPGAVTGTQSAAAIIGGLLVIAAERLADAKDFSTTGGVDVGALAAALSEARIKIKQLQSDVTNARTDVLADLAKQVPPAAPPAAPTTGVPAP